MDVTTTTDCTELEQLPEAGKPRLRRLAERGLTTVEYAIGLVAAATAALVLIRIFNDNSFFSMLFNWVKDIFGNLVKIK